MESAFEFIKKNGGITTENNYPYKAKDERCDMLKAGPFNTTKKKKQKHHRHACHIFLILCFLCFSDECSRGDN